MSENQLNTLIVALLVVAWILLERADKADVFAKLVDRLRVRLSRRVPVGATASRTKDLAGSVTPTRRSSLNCG